MPKPKSTKKTKTQKPVTLAKEIAIALHTEATKPKPTIDLIPKVDWR